MAKARSFTPDQDIIELLGDLRAEYSALGVRFAATEPDSGGWLPCHAMGRDDRNASAAVHVRTGYYKDHGAPSGESRLSLFSFAATYGPHQDFISAKRHYAEKVGIKLRGAGGRNPDKHLSFDKTDPQPELLWQTYCLTRKPGLSVTALKAAGAQHGRYRGQIPVIILPITSNVSGSLSIVGRVILPYGTDVPIFEKGEVVDRKKMKTTHGSAPGVLASTADLEALTDPSLRSSIQCLWKVEGVPDLLAFLAQRPTELAGKVIPFTNSGGCSEIPKPSVLELLTDLPLCIVGDADEAGQNGAQRWLNEASKHASTTRIVKLPYETAKNHGKDLRDYFLAGNTFHDLTDLAEDVEIVTKNPPAFSNYTEVSYGDVIEIEPRTLATIAEELQERVVNKVMRLGQSLFVDENRDDKEVRWLGDTNKLFAWIRQELDPIDWKDRKDGLVKRTELFEHLRQSVTKYRQISRLPHQPEYADTYYMHDYAPEGDCSYLRGLIEFFNPAEDIDESLILALFLTPFCGVKGIDGRRPIFVVTSDDGPGAGKSTLAEKVGTLSGFGSHEFTQFERPEEMSKRFVDPTCSEYRVVRVDNIKTNKFSSSSVESLITQPTYQGHRMYEGQVAIPNRMTWIFTVNGVSLSRDMAQRSIIIKIKKPKYADDWEQRLDDYITQNRRGIICDILALLAEDVNLSHFKATSRWSIWEKNVLARCCHPETLAETQAAIRARASDVDADGNEIEIFEDFIESKLRRIQDGNAYNVENCKVHIPSATIARWWKDCFSDGKSNKAIWSLLNQVSDQNPGEEGIKKNASRTYGRGYLFTRGGCITADYNLMRFLDPNSGPF